LYPATGHSVNGAFLRFFDSYGGVKTFGYPISDPVTENGRTVQYFERQRFEYHTEAAGTPNEVQLGRLGADLAPGQALAKYSQPFSSTPNQVYFAESRHSIAGVFLSYWRANGGLRILGYPVTEAYYERGLLVQYLERARMEYHPEIGSGASSVQLGLLGLQFVASHPDIASRLDNSRAISPVSRGEGPARQVDASAVAPLSGKEATLINLINGARQASGMGDVGQDGTLRQMALARSRDMVQKGYFAHDAPDGTNIFTMLKSASISYKYAGEIIANNNYRDDEAASQAFSGFMNSPHHHEIMLDSRYTIAGVGEATDAKGFHYFTVIFLQR
jgi:uncharacterized protein YkwD